MRLCRFRAGGGPSLGIVEGDVVLDLTAVDPGLPKEPAVALDIGVDDLRALALQAPQQALSDVRLLAPARPRKFLAIGLNYADHIAESGMEAPQYPGVLQQADHLRGRPRRRRPHAARLQACSTTRASWRSWSGGAAATCPRSRRTR